MYTYGLTEVELIPGTWRGHVTRISELSHICIIVSNPLQIYHTRHNLPLVTCVELRLMQQADKK